jgi:hypothetical protein
VISALRSLRYVAVVACAPEAETICVVSAVRCRGFVRREVRPPPWYGSDGTSCIVALNPFAVGHQISVRPFK